MSLIFFFFVYCSLADECTQIQNISTVSLGGVCWLASRSIFDGVNTPISVTFVNYFGPFSLNLTECSFIHCSSLTSGGGVSMNGDAVFSMTRCCGYECSAATSGNFLFLSVLASGSTVTFTNVMACSPDDTGLSANNAGGIWVDDSTGFSCTNTNFTKCYAKNRGDAIMAGEVANQGDHYDTILSGLYLNIWGCQGPNAVTTTKCGILTIHQSNFVASSRPSIGWAFSFSDVNGATEVTVITATGCVFIGTHSPFDSESAKYASYGNAVHFFRGGRLSSSFFCEQCGCTRSKSSDTHS
jgi:hypothetical protein